MVILRYTRLFAYGVSAAIVFIALMYALDVAGVREIFGPQPSASGILTLVGGLTLLFVGVGMVLARITGDRHDL